MARVNAQLAFHQEILRLKRFPSEVMWKIEIFFTKETNYPEESFSSGKLEGK